MVVKVHNKDTRRLRMPADASLPGLRLRIKQKFGSEIGSLATFWYSEIGGNGGENKLDLLNASRLKALAGRQPELELWVSNDDKCPR